APEAAGPPARTRPARGHPAARRRPGPDPPEAPRPARRRGHEGRAHPTTARDAPPVPPRVGPRDPLHAVPRVPPRVPPSLPPPRRPRARPPPRAGPPAPPPPGAPRRRGAWAGAPGPGPRLDHPAPGSDGLRPAARRSDRAPCLLAGDGPPKAAPAARRDRRR